MSKTVIMTVDQVQSVSAALENQVSEMQKVINEVASAHSSLAMDDILSLENYSLKLHWGLLKASSSLKKQSERLEQLGSAAKTAASGIEAEDNGEGKVASSNGGKKSNNWVSWIGAAFPFTVPFTLAPFVAGLFNRNQGNNGSTSSDAYVLTEWNGKETVEKKSDEFHQYYEELEAEHAEWVRQNTPEIRLTYNTDRSRDQHDYPEFTVPSGSNEGCCATAYATGLSIVTGKDYDPTQFWDTSAGTTRYSEGHVIDGSYDPGTVYEALKNGKPTMLNYSYAGGAGQHWVLITGTRSGADGFDPNNITTADFIALDPATGKEVPLTDVYRFDEAGIQKVMNFY